MNIDNCNDNRQLVVLKSTLNAYNIHYEIIVHQKNISTVEDARELFQDGFNSIAPSIILKVDGYYLAAIIPGDTRLSYKKIKKQLSARNISLADHASITKLTGSAPGYVSLINPSLKTIIDTKILAMDIVYGGCGIPKHTLKIKPADLVTINNASVFDFTEMKEER